MTEGVDARTIGEAFARAYGRAPDGVGVAPGRVNLLGEHTDYNGGFVLPTVIPQRTHVAVAVRRDRRANVRTDFVDRRGFEESSFTVGHEARRGAWIDYVQGVTHVLDAAGYRGVERLPIPTKPGDIGIVTADDIKAIIKRQGIAEPQPGDCVFLHTGHGNIWGNSIYKKLSPEERAKARVEFGAGEPGFGISGCEYMASRDIALMGGDTSANDAQPSGEKGTAYAVHCHTEMQTRRGIWNLENLDLKPLVDAKVYEFAFIWAPLKIVGGTGSPGSVVTSMAGAWLANAIRTSAMNLRARPSDASTTMTRGR